MLATPNSPRAAVSRNSDHPVPSACSSRTHAGCIPATAERAKPAVSAKCTQHQEACCGVRSTDARPQFALCHAGSVLPNHPAELTPCTRARSRGTSRPPVQPAKGVAFKAAIHPFPCRHKPQFKDGTEKSEPGLAPHMWGQCGVYTPRFKSRKEKPCGRRLCCIRQPAHGQHCNLACMLVCMSHWQGASSPPPSKPPHMSLPVHVSAPRPCCAPYFSPCCLNETHSVPMYGKEPPFPETPHPDKTRHSVPEGSPTP